MTNLSRSTIYGKFRQNSSTISRNLVPTCKRNSILRPVQVRTRTWQKRRNSFKNDDANTKRLNEVLAIRGPLDVSMDIRDTLEDLKVQVGMANKGWHYWHNEDVQFGGDK